MRARQIATLLLSTGVATVGGMLVNIFNAHYLLPEQFADFRLLISFVGLLVVVLPCGLFYSLGQLSISGSDPKRAGLIRAAAALCLLGLSVLASLIVAVAALFPNQIFSRDVSAILRTSAPLVGAYFLLPFLENMLQGRNRIRTLAIWRCLPPIGYLIVSLAWVHFHGETDERTAGVIQLTVVLIVGLTIVSREGLQFGSQIELKEALGLLFKHTRGYGLPLHLGALVNVSAGYLAIIILGHFVDGAEVGFFALAQTVSIPLVMVGSTIGTAYFSSFKAMDSIPTRVLYSAFALCCLAFVMYQIAIGYAFHLLFPDSYSAALSLARVAAIGYVLHGIGDMFNRYLCARGHVRAVRNSAGITGIISIFAYLLLARAYGAEGAALAIVAASSTYLIFMALQYFRAAANPALKEKVAGGST